MEKSMGKLEGWKLCHGLSSTFGGGDFCSLSHDWSEEILEKEDRIKTLRLSMILGASPVVAPQKFRNSVTLQIRIAKRSSFLQPSLFLRQKVVARTRSRQVLATKKTRPLFSENY